jgi:hypothetical protein
VYETGRQRSILSFPDLDGVDGGAGQIDKSPSYPGDAAIWNVGSDTVLSVLYISWPLTQQSTAGKIIQGWTTALLHPAGPIRIWP